MKTIVQKLLIASALLTQLKINAQHSAFLDINNIKARINANGSLFRDTAIISGADFEAPKGGGNKSIYESNLWIGGLDNGNQIKLAAQTYRQSGTDFQPGALDTVNASISPTQSAQWNKVWKINKTQVDSCRLGLYNLLPSAIATWPANPINANESRNLAPYFDANGNGIYDPNPGQVNGDCPCIKGDQAIFFIFNDAKVHQESGGNPIGLEIQGLAYAFDAPSDSALNNTIFLHYKIINRTAFSLLHTYVSSFNDFDLGNGNDDYAGSDVMRSAFYAYNGDTLDSPSQGQPGYGTKLPALGCVFLKGPIADANDGIDNNRNGVIDEYGETMDLSKFVCFNNDATIRGNPQTASDFYNYCVGRWKDGTPITFGGNGYNTTGTPCSFMFPENTDPNFTSTSWTETIASNTPGDRRGLGSVGPFTFEPGEEICLDLAYVFARNYSGSSNTAAITKLQGHIDEVQNYFDQNLADCASCTGIFTSIEKKNKNENIAIYPNPCNGIFSVSGATNEITLFNAIGEQVYSCKTNHTQKTVDVSHLPSGIYFVKTDMNSIHRLVVGR